MRQQKRGAGDESEDVGVGGPENVCSPSAEAGDKKHAEGKEIWVKEMK
jgi:hypothetical protein